MPTYSTIIKAICPHTGKLLIYGSDNVEAICCDHAREILDDTGRGHMIVDGISIAEVPAIETPESYEPDRNNIVDYENLN